MHSTVIGIGETTPNKKYLTLVIPLALVFLITHWSSVKEFGKELEFSPSHLNLNCLGYHTMNEKL